MSSRRFLLAAVLGVCAASASAGNDEAPAWLHEVATAAATVPRFDKKVSAYVLLNEKEVTVAPDGRLRSVSRYAIKVLDNEGKAEATARQSYATDTESVRDLHAWLLRPSGTVKAYGKNETADLALEPNDVYDDVRLRLIAAKSDADVGAVFGYEAVTEERPPFAQQAWSFQGRLPVRRAHYSLSLPEGWRCTGVVFNHDTFEPTVGRDRYSWELTDLPLVEDEPARPPTTSLAPRLAVSYFPADKSDVRSRPFATWPEVSRWYSELADPQAAADPTVDARARELAANAANDLDRVRAIARFVQATNYIAVELGVGKYRPHPAASVLARAYGDCKDKANLMRAMLRAVGIPAYLVLVYAGDADYVRREWTSPGQFNHCIVAVVLKQPAPAGVGVEDAQLGHLLVFDPTDPMTPVGDLPEDDQGSLALIAAGDRGALVTLPTATADANRIERQAEVVLSATGGIAVSIHEDAFGNAAATERRHFRGTTAALFRQRIESWVSAGAGAATLSKVTPTDDDASGTFKLDVDFTSSGYAHLMQGRLLVFKPYVLPRPHSVALTEPKRKYPVRLATQGFAETVRVKLPAGFTVDELPPPTRLEETFGTYTSSVEAKADELVVTRRLRVNRALVPVEQYAPLRTFFERIAGSEQTPVVLVRN